MQRVHMIGVSGTGMGALAALFRARGVRVTGSDAAFDPPIGPALREAGVECLVGYDASRVDRDPPPDLVVVGNAIRRGNVEAVAAAERDLPRASMSGALREHFLRGRRAVVVAGTHGKTTTSSIVAHVLHEAGLEPGFFIGGIPKNFGAGAAPGRSERRLLTASGAGGAAPFVVEGDEYDSVYWHKQPKFFDYVSSDEGSRDVVVLTSIEHDHIDIYPTEEAYEQAFIGLLERVPEKGLLIADATQPRVVALAREHCRARVVRYGVFDPGAQDAPEWSAAPGAVTERGQEIDVYAGGSYCGRFTSTLPGVHNVRNALAAIVVAAEAFGVAPQRAGGSLTSFAGVKRRQDLIGEPGGVRVYDDFAHHPTAVDETLRALRRKHSEGRLFAVFEPRSATACRNLHQEAYVSAFGQADRVLLAPLGRTNVPEDERLDVARLARELGERAHASASVDEIIETITREARAGDTVALLSNGAFGGIHRRLLDALARRD